MATAVYINSANYLEITAPFSAIFSSIFMAWSIFCAVSVTKFPPDCDGRTPLSRI